MSKAYLLYRPVLDYEESLDPHFIFTSKQAAVEAMAAIITSANAFMAALPDFPEGCESLDSKLDNPVYEQRNKACLAYIGNYGWKFDYSDLNWNLTEVNRSCIEIMELPLNPKF